MELFLCVYLSLDLTSFQLHLVNHVKIVKTLLGILFKQIEVWKIARKVWGASRKVYKVSQCKILLRTVVSAGKIVRQSYKQKNIISTEKEEENKSRGWDQIMPRTTVSINDVGHIIYNKGDGKKMSSFIIWTKILFLNFPPTNVFPVNASGHCFSPEFDRLPAKQAYPSYSISPSFMESACERLCSLRLIFFCIRSKYFLWKWKILSFLGIIFSLSPSVFKYI